MIASDGDLQEGIASEAASLAGHLRLGKLVVLYDDNHIQLDGPTAMAWSEDVPPRFEAYGWHTQRVEDGNDLAAIDAAIEAARADDRPSLIAVRTHIGYGSPNKQDTPEGARLAARPRRGPPRQGGLRLGSGQDASTSPTTRASSSARRSPAGDDLVADWEARFDALRATPIAERGRGVPAARHRRGGCPTAGTPTCTTYATGDEVATRNASQDAIQALAAPLPELFGGAADLSESNLTDVKGEPDFEADEPGRNLRFGVREHAMGGIANGIAYHGGFIPYCATFLTFSDYMRGSRPAGGAVAGSTSSTSGPTTRSASARTARPTSRSSTTPRSGRSRTCGSSGRATRTRPRPPGRSRSSATDGPVALALTRQKLPTLPGTDELAREGVAPRRLRPARGVGRRARS